MSIGVGEIESASGQETSPPYSRAEVALSDWPAELKEAWETFHDVEEGDMVRWGDRKQGLEVTKVETTNDGLLDLYVEGPLGGSYHLRERYDEGGFPKYYADDSSATNLHQLESQGYQEDPFTETMYDNLIENLVRVSILEYKDKDYDLFQGAANDVVRQWADDVGYHKWRGWPYEWDDETPEYIFRMVREHAGEMPESTLDADDTVTPRKQAIDILTTEVIERGRQKAHARIIDSQDDYDATLQRLADNAVDRDRASATLSPREAARSVAEDFVDTHTEPVWRAIINQGYSEPYEMDLYDDGDPEDIAREMAFDVLDRDVWDRAREEHKEQGRHDPTVRGLAFHEYDELVEVLTEKALNQHRLNDKSLLFTTVKEVVTEFADNVEAHEWDYQFGGVGQGTEIVGDGDVEDIFTSITMHSETEPKLFNPFARDKERKLAVQVLSEVVHERASTALDEDEIMATKPVPAEVYLEQHFGESMSFEDIRDDTGVSVEDFVTSALDAAHEDANLAGWTFADELVEAGDAVVPYISGEWVLVDYGLVKLNTKERRLAWFSRDNGSVLVLKGEVTNLPTEGEYDFANDAWHLYHVPWDADASTEGDRQFVVQDSNIDTAFSFARDFLGANETDIQIIETADGKHYIQEAINQDDINPNKLIPDIGPSFNLPGPDITVDDLFAYGEQKFKKLGRWVRNNSSLIDSAARTATLFFIADAAHLMNKVAPGLNVQPFFDKKYGAGVKGTYNFGQDSNRLDQYDPDNPDDDFYTGQLKGKVTITPGMFRHLGDLATPEWLYTKGSSATTVIGQLGEKVEKPIQQKTGDYFRGPRAAFLGAHLPAEADGRPSGIDDYQNPRDITADGTTFDDVWYKLNVGETLDTTLKSGNLGRLASHGYIQENPDGDNYFYKGDDRVRDALGIDHQPDSALDPAEVQELGWSLERDDLLGERDRRLVGSIEEVADGDVPCTYRAFLEVYTDLPGTPSTTMLSTLWEFYQARAEESDEFTLLDAYERYRMAMVYDHTNDATEIAIREVLREQAEKDNLKDVFRKPTIRTYLWNVTGGLRADNVFDEADRIPPFIVFKHDNRPPDEVEYYYMRDETEEYIHHRPRDGDRTITRDDLVDGAGPTDDYDIFDTDDDEKPYPTHYTLRTAHDVENVMTSDYVNDDVQSLIEDETSKIYVDEEAYNEISEEDRKFLHADEAERINRIKEGSRPNWSDLKGTDLGPLGLFLRGLSMEDVVKATDHWNLEDRFQIRADSVLPSNFRPTRPDVPSFETWFDRRRHEFSQKSEAKAKYLAEIVGELPGPDLDREFGSDADPVQDRIDQQRDVQEHYEESDPYNLDVFYGDSFGNAFDDVAEKFNEQEEYEPNEFDRPDTVE